MLAPDTFGRARYNAGASKSLLARRNSHTAATWVTVMSSSTPSDPMMMPPKSRPWRLTLAAVADRKAASSSARPVSLVACTKNHASVAMSARLASVPRTATVRAGVEPTGDVEHHEHDESRPDQSDGDRAVPVQDGRDHEPHERDEAGGERREGAHSAHATEDHRGAGEQNRQQQNREVTVVIGEVIRAAAAVGSRADHDSFAQVDPRPDASALFEPDHVTPVRTLAQADVHDLAVVDPTAFSPAQT